MVAMQEMGFRPDAASRQLLNALRNAVRRYPGRFTIGGDGRWSVG
jgi:hypothetical protein